MIYSSRIGHFVTSKYCSAFALRGRHSRAVALYLHAFETRMERGTYITLAELQLDSLVNTLHASIHSLQSDTRVKAAFGSGSSPGFGVGVTRHAPFAWATDTFAIHALPDGTHGLVINVVLDKLPGR